MAKKLTPYAGLRKQQAQAALMDFPLALCSGEVSEINDYAKNKLLSDLNHYGKIPIVLWLLITYLHLVKQ
ncbi:pesticin C-terminus-like muramidase [uncultured Shewanella sp.]|uniref:pesticin C-terminus-like muramidase n=1 Tax=uncultured Shewanella sp. TaxID=173975 RepID=UPI00345B59E9